VNGNLESTYANLYCPNNLDDLIICAHHERADVNNLNRHLNGTVDDVRLHDQVLSDEDGDDAGSLPGERTACTWPPADLSCRSRRGYWEDGGYLLDSSDYHM
jgi:hypothetical protein